MNTPRMRVRKNSTFYNTKRITVVARKAFIHTAEMTAMKEIKERKDIGWVIYTCLLSSMLAIENNRKSPITKSDI